MEPVTPAASGSPPKSLRLPDLEVVPKVGSPERNATEEAALARARELIHECDGRLCDALFELEQELRDVGGERPSRSVYTAVMIYARELRRHVEQCWATAVLR